MTQDFPYAAELAAMRELSKLAASLVSRIQKEGFEVFEKGHNDPVTRADREANALICSALAQRFPDAGVIGEESGQDDDALAQMLERERVFFIDPVDGTREFAEGRPDYCVMIGMVVDQRACLGVVSIPEEATVLWGGPSVGVFSEVEGGEPVQLRLVAPAEDEPLRAVVSRSHAAPATQRALAKLGVTHITPTGSVGVKAARVITGQAHLYIHKSNGTKLWDACAPDALLRGAGGQLTDITGKPINYRGQLPIAAGLMATGAGLFERALAAVRDA